MRSLDTQTQHTLISPTNRWALPSWKVTQRVGSGDVHFRRLLQADDLSHPVEDPSTSMQWQQSSSSTWLCCVHCTVLTGMVLRFHFHKYRSQGRNVPSPQQNSGLSVSNHMRSPFMQSFSPRMWVNSTKNTGIHSLILTTLHRRAGLFLQMWWEWVSRWKSFPC